MYKLEELTETFNKNLKKLVSITEDIINSSDMKNKSETVALFETAKRKVNMVINTDPVFMLDSAGSYLYKYRDVITNGDFNDFIMNTEKYILEDDQKEIDKKSKATNSSEVNCAEMLLKSLRYKWVEFSELEKKVVMKIVKRLLSEHCKYLLYSVNK
jgi:hypothetical protein